MGDDNQKQGTNRETAEDRSDDAARARQKFEPDGTEPEEQSDPVIEMEPPKTTRDTAS